MRRPPLNPAVPRDALEMHINSLTDLARTDADVDMDNMPTSSNSSNRSSRSGSAALTLTPSKRRKLLAQRGPPTDVPDWQFVPPNKKRRLRKVEPDVLSRALFDLRSVGVLTKSLRTVTGGIDFEELVSLGRGLLKRYTARALIDADVKAPYMLTVGMNKVSHELKVGLDKLSRDLGMNKLLIEKPPAAKHNRHYLAIIGGSYLPISSQAAFTFDG